MNTFKLCEFCNQWAQWRAQKEETKEILFVCSTHKTELVEQYPEGKVKVTFCGAVPLAYANKS